ncbi:hypothetical protein H2248_002781 [Termitomyces sp. 'cryptogamus']|nr:hypothetical protein H2248_002781 [Termitomyces sp. 'cryptogamus']
MVYNVSRSSVHPSHHYFSLSSLNHYSCIAVLTTMIIALGLRQLSAGLASSSGSSNLNSQPASSSNNRSIYNIIWSCLTVIFACAWMAVHPNIDQKRTSRGKHFVKSGGHLALFFWASFAPEIMVLVSFRQWLLARKLARKYKEFGLRSMVSL